MIRKHLVGLVTCLIVTALIVSACAARQSGSDGAPNAAGARPAVGGEVVLALPSDPQTLAVFWASSASESAVMRQLYGDGLMRPGLDQKPEPALAETRPAVSSDGRTYTFKVRQGVKFQDGEPVTARDFAFAYSVVLNPDFDGANRDAYRMIESVQAKDDYTLDIVLKAPFAPFLFSGASLPPVPRHIFEGIALKDLRRAKAWEKPVGAGAFRLVEWKPGHQLLLQRNPDYWGQGKQGAENGTVGPWVATLRLLILPDEKDRVAALEAGEISVLEAVPPAVADRLMASGKGRYVAYEWDRPGYGYQAFNTEAFPTNIKEVRQALSYGLDREAIRTGLLQGKATVPPGFIPPIHWAFDRTVQGYAFDPKKAEELLQAAGFRKNAGGIYERDGKPLRITYVAAKGDPIQEGIAQQVKLNWGALGIDVTVELLERKALLSGRLSAGKFHVAGLDTEFSSEPYDSMYAHFYSNGSSNWTRYHNADVDDLLAMSTRTTDLNERLRLYQAAQKLIVADAPENWIYCNVYTDVADRGLKGVVNWNGAGIHSPQYIPQWFVHNN